MRTPPPASTTRDLASPRTMAHTLALFFVAGGCAAILAALGASGQDGRWVVAGAGLVALAVSAAVFRWGTTWPRAVLGGLVTLGCGLIGHATLMAPDAVTALPVASISAFVGVMACFFTDRRVAVAHVATAVGATTGALLLRGDTPAPSALALAVVVVTLAVVTRALALRASDAGSDVLTGVANRRGFDEALDHHTRAPDTHLSAALLDLDHFKVINDTEGHEEGDRLLRRVAEAWQREIPAGALLARHGGDEFALLMPGVDGPEALGVVRRLCAVVPGVSVSAGVAERQAGDSAAQLMRRADRALYRVKGEGRGAVALHAGPLPDATIG